MSGAEIDPIAKQVTTTYDDPQHCTARREPDGKTVAYELCFDFGGRVFSYNGSFLSEYGKLSPGTALTAAVLQSACERGRIEYDMLRGEEAYKARWSDMCRSEAHLVLPARSLLARHHTFWAIYMKNRVKRSPWMRETADRIFGVLSRIRHGSRSSR